jgi:hypothetical protein
LNVLKKKYINTLQDEQYVFALIQEQTTTYGKRILLFLVYRELVRREYRAIQKYHEKAYTVLGWTNPWYKHMYEIDSAYSTAYFCQIVKYADYVLYDHCNNIINIIRESKTKDFYYSLVSRKLNNLMFPHGVDTNSMEYTSLHSFLRDVYISNIVNNLAYVIYSLNMPFDIITSDFFLKHYVDAEYFQYLVENVKNKMKLITLIADKVIFLSAIKK